ncbi:MAG: hypothetical protein ACI4M3_06680 [Acutalibacteraceae bacterium]
MISDSDMSRMQQEAARRVNEMHNRTTRPVPPPSKTAPPSKPPPKNEPPPPQPKPPPMPSNPCPPVPPFPTSAEHGNDILDVFMHDKERSLILLMIILLMGEDCDHSLLLALLYLLI